MKTIRAKWLRNPRLQELFAAIAAAGGEARVAGGTVRNALMGVPVGDIDIATSLSPQKITDIFSARGHGVHPTGIDHGTVTVVIDRTPFEVTTLRRDVTTDGRRAVVAFTDDWAADAKRRDFTINSLYCDANGKIHDYTNGYADLLKNRIVFVGSPAARIKEDYLRILRFFRFLAQFEKLKPDAAGLRACIRLKNGLQTLSAERIAQEMMKLLAGPRAVSTLRLMVRHSVLKRIIQHADVLRPLARLPPDALLRAFLLARKPELLQQTWRLSNGQAKRIEALQQAPVLSPKLRDNEQKRILYDMGTQGWTDAVYLNWAKSRSSVNDKSWSRMLSLPKRWPVPRFPVSGRDLLDKGFVSGPDLGLELKRLEERWMASDFKPTRDDLLNGERID